jgi:hypothetical protein
MLGRSDFLGGYIGDVGTFDFHPRALVYVNVATHNDSCCHTANEPLHFQHPSLQLRATIWSAATL